MKRRIGPIDPPSLPLSFKTTSFSSSSSQSIYIYIYIYIYIKGKRKRHLPIYLDGLCVMRWKEACKKKK
jgi:hypothetical protein